MTYYAWNYPPFLTYRKIWNFLKGIFDEVKSYSYIFLSPSHDMG